MQAHEVHYPVHKEVNTCRIADVLNEPASGGRGEEALLDSNDDAYYNTIIKKSNDFYMRNKEIQKVVTALDLKPEEKEQILIKVKPVIASIKDGDEAGHLSKFGVKDTYDLISRLVELYGPGTSKDKLEKSKEYGELYKARRDYIDNV